MVQILHLFPYGKIFPREGFMKIDEFSTGIGVNGPAFGTLNTDQGSKASAQSNADEIDISDEAYQLYAEMQASGKSPEELEAFLAENPEAAAQLASQAQGKKPAQGGQKPSGNDGNEQPEGQPQAGSGSANSSEVTTSETSLEAEILLLETRITQAEEEAEKTGNTAQLESLEAELEDLEEELDELTEA